MNTFTPRTPALLALLATLAIASPALANDGSFGGSGADLVPLKNTKVRMVSEDIKLTIKKNEWYIHATYTFENTSKTPVSVQVGFPEHQCDKEQSECNADGKFRGMRTTVRGKRVKNRIGKVSKKNFWVAELGRVFLYDVKFKGKERLQIVHKYRYGRSPDVMGEGLNYITKTGALWNGPIGHARFTVTIPWRPWRVSFPKEYRPVSYATKPTGDAKAPASTTLVFEQEQWTPKENLDLHFSSSYTHANGCPHLAEFKDALENKTMTRALSGIKTSAKAAECRNLIYAAHGYRFKKAKWFKHFYGAGEPVSKAKGYIKFTPNPTFSDKSFSKLEQTYIKTFVKHEQALKKAGK